MLLNFPKGINMYATEVFVGDWWQCKMLSALNLEIYHLQEQRILPRLDYWNLFISPQNMSEKASRLARMVIQGGFFIPFFFHAEFYALSALGNWC